MAGQSATGRSGYPQAALWKRKPKFWANCRPLARNLTDNFRKGNQLHIESGGLLGDSLKLLALVFGFDAIPAVHVVMAKLQHMVSIHGGCGFLDRDWEMVQGQEGVLRIPRTASCTKGESYFLL